MACKLNHNNIYLNQNTKAKILTETPVRILLVGGSSGSRGS